MITYLTSALNLVANFTAKIDNYETAFSEKKLFLTIALNLNELKSQRYLATPHV